MMKRTKIKSSMFIALSYDERTRELELELQNGAIYLVSDVPAKLVEQLLLAPSKGRFFHRWIRDIFEIIITRDIGARELFKPIPLKLAA